MLQVLNSKERNQAFAKFLVFFVVTTAVIVAAMYFDFIQVPEKQNEVLTEVVNTQRRDNNRQKEFVAAMQDARKLLDSLNKPGTNVAQVDIKLTGKMQELSTFSQNDSTLYGQMNKNIIEVFLDLQTARKEVARSREELTKMTELKNELTAANAELSRYRTANPGAAGPAY